MLLEAAKHLYYDGYVTNAAVFFKKIYSSNPDLLEGVDCYAASLYRDSKFQQLSRLCAKVMAMCTGNDSTRKVTAMVSTDNSKKVIPSLLDCDKNNFIVTRVEPWIVIGYYNLSKRDPKTIYFADKVC